MRARNIKPGFFRDEQLLKTSPLGRLLFAGLWCLADREGRLLDRPAQIKWDILPADDCDVSALLTELAARGFIRRYTVDGTRYIEVTRFLAHQNPHHKEKASLIPPPPDTTPAQKHDSTLLIPDSLIPDSLIPSAVSQLVGDRRDICTAHSEAKKAGATNAKLRLSSPKEPSSAKDVAERNKNTCLSSPRQPFSAKDIALTDSRPLSSPKEPASAKDVAERNKNTCLSSSRQPFSAKDIALTDSRPLFSSRQPASAKSVHKTDRKANIFFSRQDGNTNISAPCKQVKHATSWVEGFFAK